MTDEEIAIKQRADTFARKNKESFVFDGTFSNLARSKENIKRSLNKKRFVQIVYVYQDPLQAWEFVKAREIKDGRKVPRYAFIQQYFTARHNVNLLKKEFSGSIKIDLIIKNIDGTYYNSSENINIIDNHIPEKYTKDDLEKLII